MRTVCRKSSFTDDVDFGRQALRVPLEDKGVVPGVVQGGRLNLQAVVPVEPAEPQLLTFASARALSLD